MNKNVEEQFHNIHPFSFLEFSSNFGFKCEPTFFENLFEKQNT